MRLVVELDHDRKGVPGSPDLASVILEKIRTSDVIVADVTPVGHVDSNPSKRLVNSNVAIELGYALSALSDRALLMVLNEAYGTRDELPFDLRHKAGPITYRLMERAGRAEIASEKSKLVAAFRAALRAMVTNNQKRTAAAFEPAPAAAENPSRYFAKDEILARRGDMNFAFKTETLLHIRIFPQSAQPELSRVEAMRLATEGNLQVLNDRASGWSKEQNNRGVIIFQSDKESGEILSATQLLKSREIWGVDAQLLSPHRGRHTIPTGWHERLIAQALWHYISFAREILHLPVPLVAEIGLSNVEGYTLAMDATKYWDAYWGPIHEKSIILRRTLSTDDAAEVDQLLLDAFRLIFDAAGATRPDNYNGFPAEEPGSLPRR